MFPPAYFEQLPPDFFKKKSFSPDPGPVSLKSCAILPVQGAMAGYALHWLKGLSIRAGFMQGGIGSPLPMVLFGATYMFVTEGARLVYATALRILGNRGEYENLTHLAQASSSDRLRQRAWKVISFVEKVPRAVDTVFSRVFHIRSEQEIKNKGISDYNLRFVEIVRRCFLEDLSEAISLFTPFLLADKIVKSIGYPLGITNVFGLLEGGVGLILGTVTKIYMFYFKKEYGEWLREHHEKENKLHCDLLAFEMGEEGKQALDDTEVDPEPVEMSESDLPSILITTD